MGNSKGSQPDLAGAAQAQGAANKETAIAEWQLNNGNQTSPWGSKQVTQTGTYPDGTPKFSIDTTLNPQSQANLDASQKIQGDLLGLAPTAINNAWNTVGKPIDTTGLPPMVSQVDTGGMEKLDLSGLPSTQYGAAKGAIQQNLDYSGLDPLSDPTALRSKIEDASFNKFADRFTPYAKQQQDALQTRQANMGGVTSSNAAQRQMGGLLTNQGDQFRQAAFDSILAGGNATQQQQAMELAKRGQGVNEINNQGNFWNTAQNQDFTQNTSNANMWNSGKQMDAGLLGQQQQANNTATQQDIGNAFANANLANAGRAQGLQEMTNLRQMPLNELMAMLGGAQVNQPNFQPVTGTQIAPPPLYNAAATQAANNTSSANSTTGALGSLAGMGMMAF